MAVKQPYASLLVAGIKDVENRSSAMPGQLRDRWCAIYASKTLAPVGSWIEAYYKALHYDGARLPTGYKAWPFSDSVKASRKQCTTGAIVGLVKWSESTLYAHHSTKCSPWADPGMHHWTYSDRIVLPEPVPLPDGGCQSLYWYLSEDTRRLVVHAGMAAGIVSVDDVRLALIGEAGEQPAAITGGDV
jgi:hypothetical protein